MIITSKNTDQWLSDYESGLLSAEDAAIAASILEEMLSDDHGIFSLSVSEEPALTTEIKAAMVRGRSDLSLEQKQLMAIASLEGDLNEEELAEVSAIAAKDEAMQSELKILEKIRLKPIESEIYSNKNQIRRNRLILSPSFIYTVSSAAAILIIAFIAGRFIFTSPSLPENISKPLISKAEVAEIQTSEEVTAADPLPVNREAIPGSSEIRIEETSETIIEAPAPDKIVMEKMVPSSGTNLSVTRGVKWMTNPDMNPVSLMAVNTASDLFPERLTIKERLAGAIRQIALGEADPVYDPLTTFEIAGAGLNGVNKLLGWNMELEKHEEGEGSTEVIAFNSRLIKINAPKKVVD